MRARGSHKKKHDYCGCGLGLVRGEVAVGKVDRVAGHCRDVAWWGPQRGPRSGRRDFSKRRGGQNRQDGKREAGKNRRATKAAKRQNGETGNGRNGPDNRPGVLEKNSSGEEKKGRMQGKGLRKRSVFFTDTGFTTSCSECTMV